MKNVIGLFFIVFILLLFAGCSTAENTLSAVFERINASDPLPENYSKVSEEEFAPSSSPSSKQNNSYSGANFNGNREKNTTFKEWHNSQY
jgi:hypothetical protein